jgi:hypothetical protein
MAHEADYDTDLFAEIVRAGRWTTPVNGHSLAYDDQKPERIKPRVRRPKHD